MEISAHPHPFLDGLEKNFALELCAWDRNRNLLRKKSQQEDE